MKFEKGQHLNNFFEEQKVWMFSCFVINDSRCGLQDIQGKWNSGWDKGWTVCKYMCVSAYAYLCFMTPSVPVCEMLLECCVHCSKVCFSVFCSSSRNLCVFLPSGTGGGKATAAAGVTAGQQRSEGRKAAARSSSSRRGKAPGVHRTAHIGAFQWRSQAVTICPSICSWTFRANWIS